MSYKITKKTYALISNKDTTKVIEEEHIENIRDECVNIINENCFHYGSSLEGRQQGSDYKPPIILNEHENIILIPTHSIRNNKCCWLVLDKILNYYPTLKNCTQIEFINNQKIDIPLSYTVFDKQVLRATRLESILRGRNVQKYL